MKRKNVKVGQRVQYKGSEERPERKGALGTIREEGSSIPFVEWDDDRHNRNTFNDYRVSAAHHSNLRKLSS